MIKIEESYRDKIKRTINRTRYYEFRKEEILNLRHNEHWTLQEIANKYNVSRERIRQIIGNTGKGKGKIGRWFLDDEFLLQIRNLSDKEVAKLLNTSTATIRKHRNGTQRPQDIYSGNPRIGQITEKLVSEKLLDVGINNKIVSNTKCGYDILTDGGIKIEVKSRILSSTPPSKNRIKSPMWQFSIVRNRHPIIADYYIFVVPTEDVFVVRSDLLKNRRDIAFCYPTLRPEISKWIKYRNNFDLLLKDEFCDNYAETLIFH